MNKKGFTLIELLVVIAIIGILSSVVLASLNSARAKGGDAAVKGNVSGIRAQAELVYDSASPNSYGNVTGTTGLCFDGNAVNAINSAKSAAGITAATIVAYATIQGASTAVCHTNDANGWAVSVPLKSSSTTYYCVDGKGTATTTTTVLGASDVDCL